VTTVAKDLALINLKFAMWPSALYPPLCAGGGWCINVPRGVRRAYRTMGCEALRVK
jgi:hypothetical protein